MQEFNAQPLMTSPYTPAGGGNMPAGMPSSPQLGAPIPGTTGGLPAKPGLSVFQNPMAPEFQSSPQNFAQQAQSYGRGNDSMLVHMTPDEVGGLQALAMAHGGSLTINPHTGLPEAGFLGKILPTLLGALGAAFGLPTWALALGGTAAGTIASGGDLGKGLMAGLGAWGGASLAGGLGLGKAGTDLVSKIPAGADVSGSGLGQLSTVSDTLNAVPNVGTGTAGAAGAASPLATSTVGGVTAVGNPLAGAFSSALPTYSLPGIGAGVGAGAGAGAAAGLPAAKTGLAGFAQRFGLKAAKDMPGFLGKYAPYAAGLGLVNTVSELTTPEGKKYNPDEEKSKWNYAPPQAPPKREVSYQTPEQMRESGGAEYTYFTPSNPIPGYTLDSSPVDELNKDYGYAEGGLAELKTPEGFGDLVSYFQASNPGAITASRTYPAQASTAASTTTAAPAASQAEKTYTFTNPMRPQGTGSNASSATTLTAGQTVNIPGIGSYTVPNFSNMDFSSPEMQALIRQYQQGIGANATSTTQQTDTAMTPAQQLNSLRNPQGNGPSARELAADNLAQAAPDYSSTDMGQYTPQVQQAGSTPYGNINIPGVGGAQTPNPDNMDFLRYAPPVQQTSPVQQTPDNFGDFQYTPNYYEYQYARGGEVPLQDGSFVADARMVSEIGNGSSNAGREILARMGGRPLDGPGDGVSDSIRARIGGRQEARVARDEVLFPPQAVRRIGGGSERRGTQKLYALMDKAHRARKQAKRGQDTKLARGLGAIA